MTEKTNRQPLIIASRQSQMALIQSKRVKALLEQRNPAIQYKIHALKSSGDKIQDKPLYALGGKGLFVKELDQVLLDKKADFAVHSLKDVPMQLAAGLQIAAVLKRDDPRDVLISPGYANWQALPQGGKIGTCSLRRRCQLLALRPDLQIVNLRGNVPTRIEKIKRQGLAGIVLTAAGLMRSGLLDKIDSYLSLEESLPAAGQGVIAIVCRRQDQSTYQLLHALNDEATYRCVQAERALVTALNGRCDTAIGALAKLETDARIRLMAVVGGVTSNKIIRKSLVGDEPCQSGQQLAEILISQGALELLKEKP